MVEQKQMQYLMMLYRYLQDKYRDSPANLGTPKFANGVQIISKAREVYEMHQRMIPDLLPDENCLLPDDICNI